MKLSLIFALTFFITFLCGCKKKEPPVLKKARSREEIEKIIKQTEELEKELEAIEKEAKGISLPEEEEGLEEEKIEKIEEVPGEEIQE